MLAPAPAPWPPDYAATFNWRRAKLAELRLDPRLLQCAREYYRANPAHFIAHWCVTYDPRVALTPDRITKVPFVLFPRQVELVEFLRAMVDEQECGLIEKSRDMGATWICCAFSVWMWLFVDGASIGWGSRKQELVDRLGDPDSIFEKIRMTIRCLPREFLPAGFDLWGPNMSYLRIVNPENGSTITGEIGDNIGRGGRKSVYFKDESAHYVHAERIEAALTDNTNVQIDLSSVHGLGTVFHRKREAGVDWQPGRPAAKGRTNVFVMDWRDHPLKSQEWYDQRRAKARADGLLHVFAQEVERNYAASLEGVIVPPEWVNSAIDAHLRLGFADGREPWGAALDVADGGLDSNALATRKGPIVRGLEEWGERDTGATTRRAVAALRDKGSVTLQYDCVGVGAGVKAEANRLVEDGLMPAAIRLVPWNAGAEVLDGAKHVVPDDRHSPTNEDFYANLKAQAWWQLRRRFELTHRAVRSRADDATPEEKQFTWDAARDLISLPSDLPLLRKLQNELSQATMTQSTRLKLMIDKKPEGAKSPNLADAVVMAFWPLRAIGFFITDEELALSMRRAS